MSWALATMCQHACLHIGEHLQYCQKVAMNGALGMAWTWVADEAELVVLVRSENATLVYMCEHDVVYFAKAGYEFEGVDALIGQFVVDGGNTGRLLVFDVVADGDGRQRYAKLQQLQCGPMITKQWAGDRGALTKEFLLSLPHKSSRIMGLTACPYIYAQEEVY
jgi:hypothetical protein